MSGWAPEHIIATYTYTYTHGDMIMYVYIYIRSYYILKRQRKENIAMLVFLAGTLVDFFTSPGDGPQNYWNWKWSSKIGRTIYRYMRYLEDWVNLHQKNQKSKYSQEITSVEFLFLKHWAPHFIAYAWQWPRTRLVHQQHASSEMFLL